MKSIGKLEELRKEIDRCDKILIKTFQKRMGLVMEVLQNKRENKLPVFYPKREEEIIKKALSGLEEEDYAKEVEDFLREILKISKKLQSKKLFPYNIVLIGFMGTGKSTVGEALSKKLAMEYIDTDVLIEEKAGMSINQIFQNKGEVFFRDLEKKVIAETRTLQNTIIVCGGGVVLDKDNIRNLKEKGKILLLKAQPKTIYDRIYQENTRPLLNGQMSLDRIKKLLIERDEAYSYGTDIIIETDGKRVDEICTQIINELYAMDTYL